MQVTTVQAPSALAARILTNIESASRNLRDAADKLQRNTERALMALDSGQDPFEDDTAHQAAQYAAARARLRELTTLGASSLVGLSQEAIAAAVKADTWLDIQVDGDDA